MPRSGANTFIEPDLILVEQMADFRVVGSEYDKMEGVFNTSMRIVHLKLGEQMVAQAELAAKKALMICDPNGHAIRLIEE